MQKVVVILGPTGVGKSEFAIQLAKLFDGEIISADSVQVFKDLDIGSAKITKQQMQSVKHHCLSILEPDQEFSVSEYVDLTKKIIGQISSRGHQPIIVGGTALYIKALKEGYDFGGGGKITSLRESLNKLSCEQLKSMLEQKNPARSSEILPNDKKKLVRALEIEEYGQKPGKKSNDLNLFVFALTMDRNELYQKINNRVDKMFEQGLINEVKSLKEKGLTKQNQSMLAIGYKEVLDYLDGKTTLEEAKQLVKQHSRNYAKRQMTFLRGMGTKLYDVSEKEKIIDEVKRFLCN